MSKPKHYIVFTSGRIVSYSNKEIEVANIYGVSFDIVPAYKIELKREFAKLSQEMKNRMEYCAAFFLRHFVNPPLAWLARVIRRIAR